MNSEMSQPKGTKNAPYKPKVLKEGFVEKKSRVLKKWRKRFFKLNGEVLCFFKKEDHTNRARPMGRIFVADVLTVGKHFSKAKSKDYCFSINTKSGKKHIMNCDSSEERDAWILIVNFAKDDFFREEEEDPVRRRSVRLNGDFKRIKLFKDPTKGIGVRIKSVNGCVFVTRIVEDGPVAETGVLRPGDQILDVDGVNVSGMTIEQVSDVLKSAPILMSCTVKPANHFKYAAEEPSSEPKKSSYAEIDIDALVEDVQNENTKRTNMELAYDHEDDQSSTSSQSYVIMPSDDDELEDDEHEYVNSPVGHSKDTEKFAEYVNMPCHESNSHPTQPKSASPKPDRPVAPSNYLELYFEDS